MEWRVNEEVLNSVVECVRTRYLQQECGQATGPKENGRKVEVAGEREMQMVRRDEKVGRPRAKWRKEGVRQTETKCEVRAGESAGSVQAR